MRKSSNTTLVSAEWGTDGRMEETDTSTEGTDADRFVELGLGRLAEQIHRQLLAARLASSPSSPSPLLPLPVTRERSYTIWSVASRMGIYVSDPFLQAKFEIPNLRNLFAASRTEEEERAYSRTAVSSPHAASRESRC